MSCCQKNKKAVSTEEQAAIYIFFLAFCSSLLDSDQKGSRLQLLSMYIASFHLPENHWHGLGYSEEKKTSVPVSLPSDVLHPLLLTINGVKCRQVSNQSIVSRDGG